MEARVDTLDLGNTDESRDNIDGVEDSAGGEEKKESELYFTRSFLPRGITLLP